MLEAVGDTMGFRSKILNLRFPVEGQELGIRSTWSLIEVQSTK